MEHGTFGGNMFRSMVALLFLGFFIVSCNQTASTVVPKIGTGPSYELQMGDTSALEGYWLLNQQDRVLRGDGSSPENIDENSSFFLLLRFLSGKIRISQYPDPNTGGATKGIHLCTQDPNYSFDGSQLRLLFQASHGCDVTVAGLLKVVTLTDTTLKIEQVNLRTDKLNLIFSKIEKSKYDQIVSDKF